MAGAWGGSCPPPPASEPGAVAQRGPFLLSRVHGACLQTGCCVGLASGPATTPGDPRGRRRRGLGGCPGCLFAVFSVHCLLIAGLEESARWKVYKTSWRFSLAP